MRNQGAESCQRPRVSLDPPGGACAWATVPADARVQPRETSRQTPLPVLAGSPTPRNGDNRSVVLPRAGTTGHRLVLRAVSSLVQGPGKAGGAWEPAQPSRSNCQGAAPGSHLSQDQQGQAVCSGGRNGVQTTMPSAALLLPPRAHLGTVSRRPWCPRSPLGRGTAAAGTPSQEARCSEPDELCTPLAAF